VFAFRAEQSTTYEYKPVTSRVACTSVRSSPATAANRS
jgi:hypothetical protein